MRSLLISGLLAAALARSRVLSAYEKGDVSFRNGQPASAAYTAGGTSKPCTGLYCQDNPIGNPCPCPIYKPCRHDNDGHCLNRVDIQGVSHPDHECEYTTPGTWNATMAGRENLGSLSPLYGLGPGMPKGNCMCTAGSTDIYHHTKWGNCNPKNPQWCECVHGECTGNACPKPAPAPTPLTPSAPSGKCVRQGRSKGTFSTTSRMVKGLKAKVGDCRDCSRTLKGTMDKTTVKTTSNWEIYN